MIRPKHTRCQLILSFASLLVNKIEQDSSTAGLCAGLTNHPFLAERASYALCDFKLVYVKTQFIGHFTQGC